MAQTGFTPISIYYSTTAAAAPTAGNLVAGELAINTADGKLFYKDSAGVVQVIGTKGGVGSSTTTQVLYNSSGLVVGSANMTFSSSGLSLTSSNAGGSTGTLRVLDFSTNNGSNTIQWTNNAGSAQYGYIQGLAAQGLAFGNGGAEVMRMDSSGNVGIGTSSPSGKLNVAGSAATNTNAINMSGTTTAWNRMIFSNTTGGGQIGVEGSTAGSTASGTLAYATVLGDYNNNALQFITNNTVRTTIDTSGNVGIGTSSPAQKLHVAGTGDTRLQVESTSSGAAVFYLNGSNAAFAAYNTIQSRNGSTVQWAIGGSGTENALPFYTNGTTERMRINSTGQIIMGSTGVAADERLSVLSTGNLSAWFQTTNANTTGIVNVYSVIPSTAFNTACAHYAGQTAGVNTWFLYGNGTTSYVSDQNLKTNIVTTRNGYLDDLAKLRVVKYQWKANAENSPSELGLIAQEVAEVFPSLVKDSIPAKKGAPTNKVILGSVLQPILIKSVQELYSLVQEQQALIENLTTRLNALEGI